MTPEPSFNAALEQAVLELRHRLLADVRSAVENESMQGGIRPAWKSLVRRLAVLHSAARPAAHTPEERTWTPTMRPAWHRPLPPAESTRL